MATPNDLTYDVHALRYATRSSTKSQDFFRYELYGQPDESLTMDYFFFLVRNAQRTLLVDCGFDRAASSLLHRATLTALAVHR
jgi:hypothetical protein